MITIRNKTDYNKTSGCWEYDIENVKHFEYLGTTLTNARENVEIKKRLVKGCRLLVYKF